MDKRYQVFVSSTYEDLQEERKEVMQALLELDCIPAGMELFPASDEDQWTLIKRIIDDSDYYILILGGRYGSLNQDGIGYTEMEYRYALDTKKPILAFLYDDIGRIPSDKTERTDEGKEKLKSFRELAQMKMAKFWTNPKDLGGVVSRSMVNLIKNFPAVGWVRADNIIDEKSIREIIKLQQENEELRSKIEVNKTQAPSGTEDLAQGEDSITTTILVRFILTDGLIDNVEMKVKVTWNCIFEFISPHMINEVKNLQYKELISDCMNKYAKNMIRRELNSNRRYYHNVDSVTVDDQDFQKIKIQFRALGLIKQITNKSDLSCWILTDFGDYIMTKLIANKK
ncbi:MAG: DUF4062 domain-containing protein [Lachnotalea sp.]